MRPASAAFAQPRLAPAASIVCIAGLLAACGGGGSDDAAGAQRHAIGGTLTGLAANATLVLNNNDSDTLRLTANGAFTFAEPAAGYRVEVTTQPAGQTCTVTNGGGTAAAPVANVQVHCVTGIGGGGTGPTLTQGIPGLLGEWQQNTCVAAGGGQWARNYLRPVQVNDTTISHVQGLRLFTNNQCSGVGTVLGGTSMGQVTFSRIEANASVAASWGTFRQITGLTSQAVWAKRGENTLCLLGDENPSILPTLASVAAALDSLPASACYTRL